MNCDKAWHASCPVEAAVVLRCADCGKVYARCAMCERTKPARSSMQAHRGLGHAQNRDFKRRVLPNPDDEHGPFSSGWRRRPDPDGEDDE